MQKRGASGKCCLPRVFSTCGRSEISLNSLLRKHEELAGAHMTIMQAAKPCAVCKHPWAHARHYLNSLLRKHEELALLAVKNASRGVNEDRLHRI